MQSAPSITAVDPLPPALANLLRQFVLRNRRLSLIHAAGAAVAFALIWTLAWSLFDRLLPMPNWLRIILLLVEASGILLVMARPVGRWMSADLPWHKAAAMIEERNPQFAGGLQTALDQLLMPAHHRGSAALLAQIVDETAARAANLDAKVLLPINPALRPAIIAAAALILALGLLPSAWLDLPRLLERQMLPFLNAPPVTTTRLFVSPGSVSVIAGEPLKIDVRAQRLGDTQPLLQWRGDDPVFSSALMLPDRGGFSYTFDSIDRPLAYRVIGGDAASHLFDVRVIPRPSVRQLRVTYQYPDWTQLPPTKSAVFDGNLDGPLGTIAKVSVIGSEPLSKADFKLDRTRIASMPSVDPSMRVLSIPLKTSGSWHLELADANGVTGSGPSGLTIHAIPPQPPQVNLSLPSREDELRLRPRDVLTLGYEANDRYVLAKIFATIIVNAASPQTQTLPLPANHQSQAGSFDVDMAQLGVSLGDVVTIALVAQNKAGLRGVSRPCRIVVSPHSIDLNSQQRLAELREAARLAKLMQQEIQAACQAMDQSPPGDAKENRDATLAPHLAVADRLSSQLNRQLLRALAHSSSDTFSTALVSLIDSTQRCAIGTEAADAVILTEMRDPLLDRFNRLAALSGDVEQPIDHLWHGELASQLLADAQDATTDKARVAASHTPQADAVRLSAQRALADETQGCKQLGIDPAAADVDSQLRQRIVQGAETARHFGPIDFAAAASEWSSAAPDAHTGLIARLTIASEAEAIRPAGDFIWARDLELAARAARRIDTISTIPASARTDYPATLKILQDLHFLVISRPQPSELIDPLKAAEQARKRMRLWAGDLDATSQPTANPDEADSEHATLEAAAAAQQQKMQQDARLENATTMPDQPIAPPLALAPTPDPTSEAGQTNAGDDKLRQTLATAQRLERLGAQQQLLRAQTANASPANFAEMARKQAELTNAIQAARPDALAPLAPQAQSSTSQTKPAPAEQFAEDTPKDSREAAMDAIRAAQEKLLQMPREIAKARQSAARQFQAAQAAQAAANDADGADPQMKDLADLFAAGARQAADAAKAQAAADRPSPDESANLAESLRPFAPESAPAVDAIDQQLTPALVAMRQYESANDRDGTEDSARLAIQAIDQIQRRLNDALQGLLNRDALTTAKFFSDQAARALSQAQPDRSAALRLQRGASVALEQAWDNALHDAAGQRLARTPSMASILQLYPADDVASGDTATSDVAPAPRQWGRLREQQPRDLSAAGHEIDPPEYQDALRVYFSDLAREETGAGQ